MYLDHTITLEEQEQFTRDTLTGNITEVGRTSTQQLDNIVGLPWLMLLVGEACTALTNWVEVENADMMMKVLTQKVVIPKR